MGDESKISVLLSKEEIAAALDCMKIASLMITNRMVMANAGFCVAIAGFCVATAGAINDQRSGDLSEEDRAEFQRAARVFAELKEMVNQEVKNV